MKSTPEMKFWREISSRLRNHSEEPDDIFDKVVTALPPANTTWMDTTGHSFTALGLLLFCLLLNPMERYGQLNNVVADAVVSDNALARPEDLNLGSNGRDSGMVLDASAKSESSGNYENENTATIEKFKPILRQAHVANYKQSTDRKDQSQFIESFLIDEGVSNRDDDAVLSLTDNATAIHSSNEGKGSTSDSWKTPDSSVTAVTTADAAPEETKKTKKVYRPTLYLSVTPVMTYQKLTPNKQDDFVMTGLNNPGLFASDRMGIQFDAGIERQLSRRFDLRVGLSYASFGQSISFRYLGGSVKEVTSEKGLDYTIEPGESSRSFTYSFRNVGASTTISYLLKPGRLSHRAGAGISYYYTGGYFKNENGAQRKDSQSIAYTLFYRFQYSITNSMEWFVQPSYAHSLSTFRPSDEPFTMKPYRVGVGIGIVYHF